MCLWRVRRWSHPGSTNTFEPSSSLAISGPHNIHFNGTVLWFLELIHEHALRTDRAADWADPEWQMLNAGGYGTGARWFLDVAVEHNDVQLAEWCLSHGANPNSAPGRNGEIANARFMRKPSSADMWASQTCSSATGPRVPRCR